MDKPKTTIKKPALYKMVSFKGVDKSASKETKDMNEGLKVNLSAVNSLGATVNSLSIVANKLYTLEGEDLEVAIEFKILIASLYEPLEKRYLAETYFFPESSGNSLRSLLSISGLSGLGPIRLMLPLSTHKS